MLKCSPPISKHSQDILDDSCAKEATKGATWSGLSIASISGGKTVAIIRDSAMGTIQFAKILCFWPEIKLL